MLAGLEKLLVFWTEWGIHFVVLVSFAVQVTLLLLADIRRRKDWALLKVVIWSAYTLADTTAIYALGHMSVVCNWSPKHQLMAVWAPLLLVHLGGQDNITAYAIEDNRLWLRHLQTFVVQVAAAGYVLYVSNILSHPMSSSNNKVSWAAILMLVVGVLKYGERIWALKCANSCASSSLSATSYDKALGSRTVGESHSKRGNTSRSELLLAYLLLDVPKQMFKGPTSYVETTNSEDVRVVLRSSMLEGRKLFAVRLQLSMMYDLLYTKADVVHTWYGLCSRVLISMPFTVTALLLFRSSSMSGHGGDRDAAVAAAGLDYSYRRADVVITNVLLIGAVVLETMSVLRAIFSIWTAVLLYVRGWDIIATGLFCVRLVFTGECLSHRMRQHNLFMLTFRTGNSTGSKIAKRFGLEDWWDSKFYSWSTKIPKLVFEKVQELASTPGADITRSRVLDGIRRGILQAKRRSKENNTISIDNDRLVTWIWKEELKLEESILVWHIATHVYMEWWPSCTSFYETSRELFFSNLGEISKRKKKKEWYKLEGSDMRVAEATDALANYMFFLLAARPYMLPYPVSRQAYVQLCHDAVTNFPRYDTEAKLLRAIEKQKKALIKGTPLQPDEDEGIGRRQGNRGETGAAAQPQPQPQPSMNITLDRGCQLAAKLIHISAPRKKQREQRVDGADITEPRKKQREQRVDGAEEEDIVTEQAESIVNVEVVLKMVLQVWVQMLCYTAYFCNENYHAKHLTDGGEIMTIVTLLMIYKKNGLIREDTSTSGVTAGPSSQGGTGTATGRDTDSVVSLI